MEKYKSPNRRELQQELKETQRFIPWESGPSKRVKMASRKTRRQKQGKNFRPVYGYTGGARRVPDSVQGNRHERRKWGSATFVHRELADVAAMWVRIGIRILRFATEHNCIVT